MAPQACGSTSLGVKNGARLVLWLAILSTVGLMCAARSRCLMAWDNSVCAVDTYSSCSSSGVSWARPPPRNAATRGGWLCVSAITKRVCSCRRRSLVDAGASRAAALVTPYLTGHAGGIRVGVTRHLTPCRVTRPLFLVIV